MNTYQLPISYQVYGTVDINADNLDGALKKADTMIARQQISLPHIDVTQTIVKIVETDFDYFNY